MISQTLIEELKQQNIWLIYFKTITKNGNATKTPRSANNTATGADKAHADTLVTYDEAITAIKQYNADGVGLVNSGGLFFTGYRPQRAYRSFRGDDA